MDKIKIGIIGAGRIGKVHATSISRQVPAAEVKIISDVQTEGLREFADTTGISQVTSDYRDILNDPDIDAVMICSPTATHADLAMAAARAGKHIFCEKPVDLNLEKIRETIRVVRACNVKMQVGFNRRFDHNFNRIRQLITAGELGAVHIVRITSRDPAPPPPEYISQSGGIFLDMTIHDFDMALFLTGSPVTEVYASASVLIDPAIGTAGDFDTAVISLKFANGALGIIENSRQAVYGYDQRVEVLGAAGAAEAFNDKPSTVQLSSASGVITDKPLYFFLERYTDSFSEEVRQFVEAIRGNRETPVSVEDGLEPVRIALAAKKSILEKRPVLLEEISG